MHQVVMTCAALMPLYDRKHHKRNHICEVMRKETEKTLNIMIARLNKLQDDPQHTNTMRETQLDMIIMLMFEVEHNTAKTSDALRALLKPRLNENARTQ